MGVFPVPQAVDTHLSLTYQQVAITLVYRHFQLSITTSYRHSLGRFLPIFAGSPMSYNGNAAGYQLTGSGYGFALFLQFMHLVGFRCEVALR